MPRQPNPDITTTLTMLHTAVMHTDKNIRDALEKSVEKLESTGRAGHDKTTKEVVDELGRMRANFRDVHNKLNSNGDALNAAVQDTVAELRSELREVRIVLADLAPPVPLPPSPASAVQRASGAEGAPPGPRRRATTGSTLVNRRTRRRPPAPGSGPPGGSGPTARGTPSNHRPSKPVPP
ncbi:hypothetical protein SAZ_32640 [Streptomyces noursei ZPM]|uniref:Uncharacterized protein n=1 Tax=Streptomyces noursei TaxID=1971 RepID=A0A401R9V6_STRNR|nr:hypothetical protein [Streptomyces noursei]AKA08987.1 hypothetical protein SAZ_32640 [Streptomyces noursei ZPM]EOT05921.1 hypothetical protein K530_01187 [Streptomyces noursei CCRC 11814]UWS75171.1 hypothetical protein N1H47_30390 [Streptomyces noursei]GCB94435.1 hypothetical protein SALB_07234 [Streptomyces noursei]